MEVSLVPADGRGDAEALGVHPRTMALGARPSADRRARERAGAAASSAAASASSGPSPAGPPTSWTPSGRPSAPSNSGSESAGRPHMLKIGVNGVK